MFKKNLIILGIGTILTKLLSYLLIPILTFVFTTSEFGTIDLINTTIELIIPITTLSIIESIIRFTSDSSRSKEEVLCVGLLFWAIGSAICFPSIFFIDLGFEGSNYLLFIYLSLYSLFNILTYYQKGCGKTKLYTLFCIEHGALSFGLILLFVFAFKLSITGYYLGFISSLVVSLITVLIVTRPFKTIIKTKVHSSTIKEMIKFSAPLVLSNICWWLLSASDKYITLYILGTDATGILAIVHKIPTILVVLQTIFSSAFKLSVFSEYNFEERNDADFSSIFSNIYQKLIIFLAIIVSVICILIEPFTRFFIESSFYESYKFVPIYSLAVLVGCLCVFFDSVYGVVKKNSLNMISVLIGALVNVGLCILFLGPLNMGLLGAGLSTLIAEITILLIRRITTYKYVQIKVNLPIYIAVTILIASVTVITFVSKPLIFIIVCSILLLALVLLLSKQIKDLVIFFLKNKKESN